MKKSIILIKKNYFCLDGEEYDFDNVDEINSLFKPNIKMVILEEELYAKHLENNMKKRKMYEFIKYKINNDFPQNGDILYDYDFKTRHNIISIYSMRGAKRVEKLSEKAINIEVKPIQFIIKDIITKILKNKFFNGKVLTKIYDSYYYLSFENGLFCNGFIEENEELVLNRIIENDVLEEIYVDDDSLDILMQKIDINKIKINIGELINEKIYKG